MNTGGATQGKPITVAQLHECVKFLEDKPGDAVGLKDGKPVRVEVPGLLSYYFTSFPEPTLTVQDAFKDIRSRAVQMAADTELPESDVLAKSKGLESDYLSKELATTVASTFLNSPEVIMVGTKERLAELAEPLKTRDIDLRKKNNTDKLYDNTMETLKSGLEEMMKHRDEYERDTLIDCYLTAAVSYKKQIQGELQPKYDIESYRKDNIALYSAFSDFEQYAKERLAADETPTSSPTASIESSKGSVHESTGPAASQTPPESLAAAGSLFGTAGQNDVEMSLSVDSLDMQNLNEVASKIISGPEEKLRFIGSGTQPPFNESSLTGSLFQFDDNLPPQASSTEESVVKSKTTTAVQVEEELTPEQTESIKTLNKTLFTFFSYLGNDMTDALSTRGVISSDDEVNVQLDSVISECDANFRKTYKDEPMQFLNSTERLVIEAQRFSGKGNDKVQEKLGYLITELGKKLDQPKFSAEKIGQQHYGQLQQLLDIATGQTS